MIRRMIILVCGIAAFTLAQTSRAQDSQRKDISWNDAPRITPFDGVRWKGNVPEVHVAGDWYGLVSFNDLPAADILAFSKSADEKDWKKRFDEDLMAILIAMGHTPGKTADLKLKDLQTGEVKTMEKVPMTEENRRTLMDGHPNDKDDATAQTARAQDSDRKRISWNGAPEISPFDGVRWKGDVPEVHVAGDWYGLVSFNDLPAADILAFTKSAEEKDWKKRFDEDLMAILIAMGHTPGTTADLKLKDLQTGEVKTMEKVPMTEENRRTLREGHPNDKDDAPAETRPSAG